MKGKVYIARRPGELDSATRATAREQSEAWWNDCLRDGGTVIEIEYDDESLSAEVKKYHSSVESPMSPAGDWRVMVLNLICGPVHHKKMREFSLPACRIIRRLARKNP